MFENILMVCTGNICRSPMAEALLAQRLSQRGVRAAVASAGLAALVGHPADPEAQALMAERGLDLSAHRARQLTPELLRGSDLVLVMEVWQQRAVEALLPSARGRVQRLGRLGDFDVPDPFRRGPTAFRAALVFIDRGLDDLVAAFWKGTPPP